MTNKVDTVTEQESVAESVVEETTEVTTENTTPEPQGSAITQDSTTSQSVSDDPLDFEEPADDFLSADDVEAEEASTEPDSDTTETDSDDESAEQDAPDHWLTNETADLAEQYGITRQQAERLGSEEAVGFLINAKREAFQLGLQQAQQQQTGDQQTDQQTQPTDAEADYHIKLDESVLDEWSDEFSGVLKSIVEKSNANMDAVIGELNNVRNQLSLQYQIQEDAKFDEAVSKLDESLFGVGDYDSLKDSNQQDNRVRLHEYVTGREQSYVALGKTPPVRDQLIEEGHRALWGDKMEKQAREKIAKQVKRGSKRITQRSNTRNEQTLDPYQSALQFVAKATGQTAEVEDYGDSFL